MFKRKIYNDLLEWKNRSNGETALLIEGARRIGKTTIVEEFGKNEYEEYVIIDFSIVNEEIESIFNKIFSKLINIDDFYSELKRRESDLCIIDDRCLCKPELDDILPQNVDLVLYNYKLKCFVLIDLKRGDLTHQDIGQMQMYVNYYTRELMEPGDNPPIGIVLCADKSDTLVRYTLPLDNKQIYASKYMLYLPKEEDLQSEINKQIELLEGMKKQ